MDFNFLKGLSECQKCSARKDAKAPVYPEGFKSSIMVVGRNPGKDEDKQGIPFIGKAGLILNKFLFKCEIPRQDCYITNTVKCYTRSNRVPDSLELHTCAKAYLREEIKALNPILIFVLGSTAYEGVFGHSISPWVENTGVIKYVVQRTDFSNKYYVILPHPAATIYRPQLIEKYNQVIEGVKEICRKENLVKGK